MVLYFQLTSFLSIFANAFGISSGTTLSIIATFGLSGVHGGAHLH